MFIKSRMLLYQTSCCALMVNCIEVKVNNVRVSATATPPPPIKWQRLELEEQDDEYSFFSSVDLGFMDEYDTSVLSSLFSIHLLSHRPILISSSSIMNAYSPFARIFVTFTRS